MAFRGRSSVPGLRPRWLKTATDIRFLDHQGDDASVLYFEVPQAGRCRPGSLLPSGVLVHSP